MFYISRLKRRKAVAGLAFLLFIAIFLIISSYNANSFANSGETTEELSTDSYFYSQISSLYPQFQGAILFLNEANKNSIQSISEDDTVFSGGPSEQDSPIKLATISGSSLIAKSQVLTVSLLDSTLTKEALTFNYKVEDGDTLSSIAEDFGVSLQTLLWANNMTSRSVIRPGDEITILPVNGVTHTIKRGDTISAIANRYDAEVKDILAFNNLTSKDIIKIGDVLVVPGGKPYATAPSQTNYTTPLHSLVNLDGYFGLPAQGRLTQGLHRYNAVDMGGRNYCNTPIYASADGRITKAVSSGWNGGYGKYVKISHSNGTLTLYAHNSQILVSVGEQVAKGDVIALMGDTGNTTGCHVHFEIRGARNPFGQ